MSAERLQKVLASSGLASRRQCEALIVAGRVSVNGRTAVLGQRVDVGRDIIQIDNQQISAPRRHLYLALNKPAGIVTSLRSTHGERTVVEFLPTAERVAPVGRLDKESAGLLLFTNDGDWANLVTHPRYQVEKVYEVSVTGQMSRQVVEQLCAGITLEDGSRTAPATISVLAQRSNSAKLSVTVIEGKKRQLRQMFALVGHPVRELRRVRIGPITLGTLPEGVWRPLRPEEVDGIRGYRSRAGAHGTAAPN